MDEIWYHDYIENVDTKNVKWVNLSTEELKQFFKENYFDQKANKYASEHGYEITPFGMYYITIEPIRSFSHVLGIAPNNKGTNTVIGAMCYVDNYKLFSDQKNYITYFSTIEVNRFFRNQGFVKKLIAASYDFVKHDQHILISELSDMGRTHNLLNITKNIYYDLGFQMDIRCDIENFNLYEYRDLLLGRTKVKRLTK